MLPNLIRFRLNYRDTSSNGFKKQYIIIIGYENLEVKLPIKMQEIKNEIPETEIQYVPKEILNEYQQFLLLNNNTQNFNDGYARK